MFDAVQYQSAFQACTWGAQCFTKQNFTFPGRPTIPPSIWDAAKPHQDSRTPSTRTLQAKMKNMLSQSLAPASQVAYNNHWSVFHNFMASVFSTAPLPASSYHISLFMMHLHSLKLKAPSIRSYLSAIAFTHKIHGHADPTGAFSILKLLEGLKRESGPPIKRLPITKIPTSVTVMCQACVQLKI